MQTMLSNLLIKKKVKYLLILNVHFKMRPRLFGITFSMTPLSSPVAFGAGHLKITFEIGSVLKTSKKDNFLKFKASNGNPNS